MRMIIPPVLVLAAIGLLALGSCSRGKTTIIYPYGSIDPGIWRTVA